VEGLDGNFENLKIESYKKMIEQATRAYPNFKVIGTTLRTVKTASINDWGAVCWYDGSFYEGTLRENLEIMDRVGGGDSFASGLIFGFMETGDPKQAVEYGAAHGALAMTTPGDTSMASRSEVEKVMGGASARVVR
jgi:2-dehydro-3-deoxygluconokinase